MAKKNSKKVTVPVQDGVFHAAIQRFKLIMRLIGDNRVSPWLKLIPIGVLIYWVSPFDLIMGIPGIDAVDDAAVIWIGTNLFVELCPPDVVNEHMAALSGNLDDSGGEIVDAESVDDVDE